jgi:integrase
MEAAGVGASTRAKCYRLLSRILGQAVEAGYLSRNPCMVRGAASEPRTEMRFAIVDQVAELAEAMPPRFKALVLVAAYTGLRWGELAGLRVKRVDLLHRRVTVAEQLTETRGSFAFGPPKTAAGMRTVTLPMVATTALAAYAEPGPDGLVFPAERRGPLRRSNFTRRVWMPATHAVGVEGLRFHDLRHTAATLAIAAGASTRELMVRMGHSSSAAALRYQHVMADRDTAIAAALDELVQAASTLAEDQAAARSGTRVARGGSKGSQTRGR